jgi:plastocyanin domain-containing protein
VSVAQYAVSAVGVAAIVWVLWYFLYSSGPAAAAAVPEAVQEVRITVKGGFTPDTVVVRAGTPVRLRFYRDETAERSERVVIERFGIDVPLPAFQTTAVEFMPEEAGEFPFRCGTNVLEGLLVVEPATAERRASASPHRFHE